MIWLQVVAGLVLGAAMSAVQWHYYTQGRMDGRREALAEMRRDE